MGKPQPDQLAGMVRAAWIGRGRVHGVNFPSGNARPLPALTASSGAHAEGEPSHLPHVQGGYANVG